MLEFKPPRPRSPRRSLQNFASNFLRKKQASISVKSLIFGPIFGRHAPATPPRPRPLITRPSCNCDRDPLDDPLNQFLLQFLRKLRHFDPFSSFLGQFFASFSAAAHSRPQHILGRSTLGRSTTLATCSGVILPSRHYFRPAHGHALTARKSHHFWPCPHGNFLGRSTLSADASAI